jgi:hypothetical protein
MVWNLTTEYGFDSVKQGSIFVENWDIEIFQFRMSKRIHENYAGTSGINFPRKFQEIADR